MAQAAAQVLPGPPKEQVALPEEWQFSMQELEHSPSRKEGVSMEDELLWRSDCCQLVSDMTHKLQDKWGREDDRRREEREQRRRKGQSSQKEKPFDPAKLPLAQHRKVVGTACALVHRFFIRRSFLQFDRRVRRETQRNASRPGRHRPPACRSSSLLAACWSHSRQRM